MLIYERPDVLEKLVGRSSSCRSGELAFDYHPDVGEVCE
jgi:hypothetical protein